MERLVKTQQAGKGLAGAGEISGGAVVSSRVYKCSMNPSPMQTPSTVTHTT
jgi:hypothetical protein